MNSTPAQELLRHFQAFLEESGLSRISIKNYVSDVRQFLMSSNLTSARLITHKQLQDYLTQIQNTKPTATYKRYSASLRQFVSFLAIEYRINLPPLTSPKIDPSPLTTQDLTNQFKTYLQNEKRSHSTIKNYISDLNHYWAWSANNQSSAISGQSSAINRNDIDQYLNHLKLSHIKSSVVNRREAALNKFEKFANPSVIPSMLEGSSRFLHYGRNDKNLTTKKPTLYQRYHALPFTPYLHLAILVLFTTALGLFAYDQIIKQAKPELAYPTALTRPTRQLSFQGRLTDSSDTPIITATNLSFKLYSALTGGSALYNSGTCSVSPDTDGIFNTVIGDGVCGAEIGSNIFSENASLYLEVLVGAQTLTPRQPIATVGYALNSETLQGYPASASAVENTVPIMNNDGDIILGASSPTIQSTSDTFAIKGQAMTLSTNTATNGNISLAPDGTGGLNAIGGATTGNFLRITDANLTSGNLISGYVGNDTATGNLLALSSGASETTKFSVNRIGNIFTSGSATISATLSLAPYTQGAAGTCNAASAGKMYYDGPSNVYYFCNGTTWTQIGSGSGGGTSYWDQASGLLYPVNSTVDLSIGGQSSASAKFAFLNIDSGTPTLSFANQASAIDLKNTTVNALSIEGGLLSFDTQNSFIGIGDTTPSNKLDVNGVVAGTYFVDYSNNAYGLDPAGTANFGGYSMQITGGALLAVDSGNVGIGSATPTAKLDVGGTASVSGILSLASSIGTQAMTSMNIGNSTTGNIVIDSGSNAITLSDNVTLTTGSVTSSVADSATAVGFTLNTASLTTQGSKLLSVKNASTEKFYIDKDGNLYTAGTILSGNGQGMLMTNKSGGTVANRSLVVLDTTTNSSFTTTTTAYAKTGFGVVTGVGLGVANDADGDGACDANDICMIAIGGEVNVTTTNASTATKGDYLFTSATAGSAVASAKQFDGLIGIVSSTANAASGYLKMIFKVQPQVTAAASIDKGSKHNEYWLYANKYLSVGEGADVNANLLARGLMFDNFLDSTKTDSANTTVSSPTQFSSVIASEARQSQPASPFRTGLIGGQTLATSTTDNAGNTYLGSNTVNKTILYDRTRDSSPQVQVELGIDPNWYNGVTLSVATTSAQFSQNSVIASGAKQSNPNLSTSYNGSAIKITGNYTSNAKTIYITIKSPTTFDWTDYNGQAATGVTITPGTAQTLGGTGVSAKFTDTRYNTGDVFKIASWFVEPSGSTRGGTAKFPERATIIATASSVDIIDADTQKLWMRFSQGTSYAIGVDANNDPNSVNMLNGKMYVATNGSSATGLYRLDFTADAAFKQNATDWRLSDSNLAQRNGTNTYNVLNTSNILVNITANDVSAAVIPNQPTQTMTVSGWGYQTAINDTGILINETVNLPYKFNSTPTIEVSNAGYLSGSNPTKLSDCTGYVNMNVDITAGNQGSASFQVAGYTAGSGWTNYRVCYTWTATGVVSPRQFAAAATDAGVTVVNETDSTAYSYSDVTGDDYNSVQITTTGKLYALNETQAQLEKWRDIASNTASETNGTPDKVWDEASTPALTATAPTINTNPSLTVTEKTSTINSVNDTIYVGTNLGASVIQDNENWPTANDGSEESSGSVKYYTKDYISEEMVGDIRGMWPMYETSGTAVADVSVKAANGTATGTTIVSGVRGKARSFNGTSSDYIDLPDSARMSLASGMTISGWIKTATKGTVNNQRPIYSSRIGGSDIGVSVMINTSGQISFLGGNTIFNVSGSTDITDNNWHFFTVTWDGTTTANKVIVYVDGALNGIGTSTGTLATENTGPCIGIFPASSGSSNCNYAGTDGFFNGTIDEITKTATALTAGQIKHMYEVGYRALQGHGTTLGGGGADLNQQLGFISTGTNTVGAVGVDYNNQFMYVGTNSTTLGAVSKIDLNSDTNIKTYNSSANVPAGGALLVDEDTKSLAVGYNLEAVGSATTGVKTMGVDNASTSLSASFISKTVTTAESFTQAYLWAQYTLDSSDTSNTVTVSASNDGGSNYYQCNATNTDTSQTPTEYEYFCQFASAGSALKTKFALARGSTKTNTYLTRYGIAWIGSDAIGGAPGGNGLYTNNNASVANGSYIDVAHNQNSNDVVTNGWVYDSNQAKWINLPSSQPEIPIYGNGKDGAITVTAAKNLNTETIASGRTYADGIAYKVDTAQSIGNDTLTTVDTPSGLAAGDEVLLINLQGASGDTADVGNYEFLTINTINTKTITFNLPIKKHYTGTTASNQKVVIQRVPQYTNVTLSGSGSLTASAWNALVTTPTGAAGYLTGIVAFRATGTVTVGSGTSITTANKGYRGASTVTTTTAVNAKQGEGHQAGLDTTSTVANGNGGGGGTGVASTGAGGGGGGGHAVAGTNGANSSGTGGTGGNTVGAAALTSLFLGGGGGGGGAENSFGNSTTAGGGGIGGGIIFISGSTITVSGTVSTNGQTGTDATGGSGTNSGGGGGGSGGSVFLASGTPTLGSSLVTASAGSGGANLGGNGGAGGGGGVGRIRVEYTGTLSGTTSPAASTATTLSSQVYPQNGPYVIKQQDANTVRLYNYSGAAQNLRLDVITGGLGRNAGTVSLAPAAADVDAQSNVNSIWVNKTGTGGTLLKLQNNSLDVSSVALTGDLNLSGNVISAGGSKYLPIFYEGQAQTNDTFFDSFTFDKAVTITKVTLSAKTAPTGSALTVDLTKNGSVQSRTATLAAGSNSQSTDITDTAYTSTDTFGLKVTGIGSTEPGRDISVIVHYREQAGDDATAFIAIPYEGSAVTNDIAFDGFYPDAPITITKVSLAARNAPTGSALTVDLTKNGSVQSRTATLAAGATYQRTDITDTPFSPGERLGVKVTGVGSTVAGEGLTIILSYTHDRGDTGAQYLPFLYPGVAQNADDVLAGWPLDESVTISSTNLFARTTPTGANLTVDLTKNGSVESRTMTLAAGATYQQTNIKDDTYTTSDTLGLRITGIGSSTTEGESIVTILHTGQGGSGGGGFVQTRALDGQLVIGSGDYSTLSNFSFNDGSLYISGNIGVSGTAYLEGGTVWTSADLAENYSAGEAGLAPGEVVTLAVPPDATQSARAIYRARAAYDPKLLGIISTKPAGVLNGSTADYGYGVKPVALSGRVPVKIDPDSAPIAVGDFLTSSDKPGLAQKATKAGYTIGKALENWSPSASSGSATIEVFVNLGYYMGELTSEGFLTQDENEEASVAGGLFRAGSDVPTLDTRSDNVSSYENFVKWLELWRRAGGTIPSPFEPKRVSSVLPPSGIHPPSTSTMIASASAWLRENWDSLSKMNTDIIQSLWIKTGILTADTLISPVAEIDTLRIKDKLLSPLANIDTIYSSTISAETASISGTLYATNIESPTIDLLSTNYQLLTTNYATASAILATIRAKYDSFDSLTSPAASPAADPLSSTTDLANFNVVITDSLMVNTSLISNSINSNDTTLYIQPTANQPINLLAGLMTLTPDGQVVINGDLTVTGNLYADKSQITNLKSQIITTNDLIIASSSPCSPVIASGSEAIYPDGSPRGYTRDDGVWVATSSATPRNDNCDATVSGTLNSNASIGIGTIASDSAEVKIENSKIKDSTYIYLTPISDTQNQVLYVKSKTSCPLQDPSSILGMTDCIPSFTAAVNATPSADIKFNYWLIKTQ